MGQFAAIRDGKIEFVPTDEPFVDAQGRTRLQSIFRLWSLGRLAEIGIYPVIRDEAADDGVVVSYAPSLIDDVVHMVPETRPHTASELKEVAKLAREAALSRTPFTIVRNGVTIETYVDSGRDDVGFLLALLSKVEKGDLAIVQDFKMGGEFYDLSAAEFAAVASAVDARISTAFAVERACRVAIDAGEVTTPAEVEAALAAGLSA